MKQLIKLSILATVTLSGLSLSVQAQAKKSKQIAPIETTIDVTKSDTLYVIKGDKNINLLYSIFQRGYAGAMGSADFSENDRKNLLRDVQHVDSILLPQVKKYHPAPTKPTTTPNK